MTEKIDSNEPIFIQDINNIEEINNILSKLIIQKPVKKNDIYYSNVNLMFQSSKITINSINKGINKINLNVDEKLEELLEKFDNKVKNYLITNSDDLFEENITDEEIDDIYSLSTNNKKSGVYFKVNLSKKLIIYNKSKNILDLSDLNINDEIICLFKCSKIIYYKNYCKAYWEVLQIKHKKLYNSINLKEYIIRDDENDNYKSDTEDNQDMCLKEFKLRF